MTVATKTTRKARAACTCPACAPLDHTGEASTINGVYMCRGGERIEFYGYHEGRTIVISDMKSAAQADLDDHRNAIARRALSTGTLDNNQVVLIEALANEADLAAEVAVAAAEASAGVDEQRYDVWYEWVDGGAQHVLPRNRGLPLIEALAIAQQEKRDEQQFRAEYNEPATAAWIAPSTAPLPFTPDHDDPETLFLIGEERRAGVPEAQVSRTPVSDLIGARVDVCEGLLDRIFGPVGSARRDGKAA